MHITFEMFNAWITLISRFTPLAAVFIGVLNHRHLPIQYRLLLYLLIYGFINDEVTTFLPDDKIWPFNNIYFVFETVIMAVIMTKIETSPVFKKIIIVTCISLVLFGCVTFFVDPKTYFHDYNKIFIPARSAMLSVIAGIMIYRKSGQEDNLLSHPAFWLLVAFFTYLFCNMIVFIAISLKLNHQVEIRPKVWCLHNAISSLSNLIYAYAFYLAAKRKTYAAG